MRKTEKKLKAKHFRYLSKENIENPMCYINNLYKSVTNLASWLDDLNALVNASFCAKMKGAHQQWNGYHCKTLIEQVEFAYSIFVRYNLKKKKGNLNFHPVDYRQISSLDHQSLPKTEKWFFETLRLFFSFQDLKGWYETLDRIWVNLIDMSDPIEEYERIGEDRLVIIKELFTRLAIALDLIHEIGEFPKYKTNDQLEENVASKNNNQNTNAVIDSNDFDTQSSSEIRKTQISDPHRDRILEKLRTRFGEDDLETWQSELHILHLGINTEYDSWNEAFKLSSPGSTFYFCARIHKIIRLIGEEIRYICGPNKFPFEPSIRHKSYQQLIHKKRTIKLLYLSHYETLQPEYYLYQLFEELPEDEWEDKFNELIEIFLSLDNNESFEGNGGYFKFLQQLQKCIELSFIIAFKDEIEFISPTESEKQEI